MEFAEDSGQALADFDKLVLGSARNKLLVGPRVGNCPAFLIVLGPAAAACSGQVFAALLPHPRDWATPTDAVRLWQFDGFRWRPVN